MAIVRSVALGGVLVAGFAASLGCTKKVDPSAFDAGATVDTAAATDAAAVADADVDATAPLAPLSAAKPVVAPPHHSAAPKPQPPECLAAARFCNHPAIGKDKSIQLLCDQNKTACTSKGGHFP